MDIEIYLKSFRFSSCHLQAVVKDLGFFLETGFGAQTTDNGEMAPMIQILDFRLALDNRHSDITITGGIIPRLVGVVVDIFHRKIFNSCISKIEHLVSETLP